jgi:serine/threonine protein kinase/tetratricopeptide (TPR) repeat protein
MINHRATPPRSGDTLADRFELAQLVGEGGMANVFRARDRHSGALVALKLLRVDGGKSRERFDQEAELLRGLEHRGIVRYVAHGSDGGEPFLAMEWLEGEPLAARLARGPLGVVDSVKLGLCVATALAFAHARGVVHRDIKPSNLFLPAGDVERVKILDFGIAQAADRARITTDSGGVIGTVGYMAPEQACGDTDVDTRADVFSLGCVLHECITGRPTFGGDHLVAVLAKILFEEAPSLLERGVAGVGALDALLARMLHKDRSERPRDGAALAAELGALPAPGEVAHASPSRPPPSLTQSEQRLFCVVVAGEVPDDPAATLAREDALDLSFEDTVEDSLYDVVRSFNAQLERLVDGSVVATLVGHGVATDQAARAARCALAMRTFLPEAPMALAIGRGEAAGALPSGEVIDRAAALLMGKKGIGSAAGQGISVDAVTCGLLPPQFEVRRSGAMLDLVSEREVRAGVRTLLGKPTPCVGRERELELLRATFEECAAESSPRVVLITGAPGVGKSRLRAELVGELAGRRMQIWESHGDAMNAGAPYAMIAPLVRHAAGLLEGDSAEVRREKLARRVGRHVAESERRRVAEFLGELGGVPSPPEPSAQLRVARADAIVMVDQVRRAFIDLVAAEAANAPLLLVLEDLHWGDVPSVTLLDAALRVVRDRPWMVLALARPDVADAFPRLWEGRGVTRVELRELSDRAAAGLVRHALGQRVSGETVERVVAQAAGNPFYLEELIRALAEGQGDALPGTVVAMVQTRLEALGPDARRVLRAASLLGEVFSHAAVAALVGMAPGAPALSATLGELVDKELISERAGGLGVEASYGFRHAVTRDVAYGMLTADDRALGHRLAGEWLEAHGSEDALRIAEHFERGGEPARAVDGFRRGAEEALAGNDFEAALAHAARGLACGAAGATKGALHMVRCDARAWCGDHAAAIDEARAAMELFARGSEPWFAAIGRRVLECRRLGRVDEATAVSEVLLADWPSDASNGAVVAACLAADTLCLLGRPALGCALVDAVDERVAPGDELELVTLGHVYRARGLRDHFRDLNPAALPTWLPRSIDAFDAAGDVRNACVQRGNLGYSLIALGAYEDSERALRAALETASRLGLVTLVSVCEQNLGAVLGRLGRVEEGCRVEQAAAAAFASRGDHRLESAARAYLALLELQRGDVEAALREAERAVDVASTLAATRARALATLARVHLARRDPARALPAAAAAHVLVLELGALEAADGFVRLVYAEALAAAGEHNEAAVAIADARDQLLARAGRMTDPRLRASYLERVPESVRTLELAAAWRTPDAAS